MYGKSQVQYIVDNGNFRSVKICQTVKEQSQRKSGSVFANSDLHVLGVLGSLYLNIPLHHYTVSRNRRIFLSQPVQQRGGKHRYQISQRHDCKRRCVPFLGIVSRHLSPHAAHGNAARSISSSHNRKHHIELGFQRRNAADNSSNGGKQSRNGNRSQNGRNESRKGPDQQFSVNRENRSRNQNQNVQVQKAHIVIEITQNIRALLRDYMKHYQCACTDTG